MSLQGMKVLTTYGILKRGVVVEDRGSYCIVQHDGEEETCPLVLSDVHGTVDSAIRACEGEVDYWQRKLKQMSEYGSIEDTLP